MSLQIYNTLTRKKEDFIPLNPKEVKIYVCGPTVYNFLHVGNFRGPVFFNLVRNWLEESGFKVQYAINFTDVDDRIIDRAVKGKVPAQEISEKYIAEYKKDYASLGLRPPESNPKVTEHMEAIRKIISSLVEKKNAYVVDGEVLFSIKSFPEYGKLSNRNPEDLLAGSRVEVDPKKKDPMDFALWKPAKANEPSWESPWSKGRPGWHIECSAMIDEIFAGQVDIHGGGMDLVFPHHENEIAQSEAAHSGSLAKYWMHWQMLNLSGNKMSKSIGNVQWLRDFVQESHAEIYKYLILSVHYRTVCDFSETAIEKSIRELARFYSALAVVKEFAGQQKEAALQSKITAAAKIDVEKTWQAISASLNDDFSTPEVMASLFELVRHFNAQVKRGMKLGEKAWVQVEIMSQIFQRFSAISSLFHEEPTFFLRFLDDMLLKKKGLERARIDGLAQERWQAKQTKDFTKADELRKQLTELGIMVMDTATETHWEVAK